MRRALAVLCLGFGWLCANGALWDVMQVAAWGRMFAGYSATMPLGEALRATLDPSKPCEMCVGIAKAKDESAKHALPNEQTAAAKFVLALPTGEAPLFHEPPVEWSQAIAQVCPRRSDPVRLRPPRV